MATQHRAGALLAAGIVALATTLLQAGALGETSPGCPSVFCDATRYYLPTFRGVLEHHLPSGGFLYPPFFALAGIPFGLLGDGAFLWAWGALQLAGFLLLALAPAGALGRWTTVYLGLLAFSEPVVHNMVWGNVSVLLAGMILTAVALEQGGRRTGAAAVLGCAAAIKYYPAVFLLPWALRRDWRFVGAALGWAALFSLVPIFVLGPAGMLDFLAATRSEITFVDARAPTVFLSQAWPMVLGRLAGYTGAYWPFAIELWAPLVLLLAAGAAWAFVRAVRAHKTLVAIALIWLLLPFANTGVWPHYLAHSAFCQVVVLREAWGLPQRKLLTTVLALPVLLTTWVALVAVGVAIHPAVGVPMFSNLVTLGVLIACVALDPATSSLPSQPAVEAA